MSIIYISIISIHIRHILIACSPFESVQIYKKNETKEIKETKETTKKNIKLITHS